MSNKIVTHLTGGLGNQLFQFAAALSVGLGQLEFETSLGKPRGNKENIPDLFAFKLPLEITTVESSSKFTNFAQKVSGFALRSAVAPKGAEKLWVVSKFIEASLSIILFIRTKHIYRISRGSGVGYSILPRSHKTQYLVGYFQSYLYAASTRPQMMTLEPVVIGPQLIDLINLSKNEAPLVVHFRLGDYLQESGFGIPGHQYYIKALKESWNTGRYKAIWVFSDDISSARELFPIEFLEYVRWISEVDASPAATLHAMRFGHGYVIANSTFSWWGAYLSMTVDAPVIAPVPWFKTIETPKNLFPPHWKKEDSDF